MEERKPNLSRVPIEILEREVDDIQRDLRQVEGNYSEEEIKQMQESLERLGLISTVERARDTLFINELVDKGILDKQDMEEELQKRDV